MQNGQLKDTQGDRDQLTDFSKNSGTLRLSRECDYYLRSVEILSRLWLLLFWSDDCHSADLGPLVCRSIDCSAKSAPAGLEHFCLIDWLKQHFFLVCIVFVLAL